MENKENLNIRKAELSKRPKVQPLSCEELAKLQRRCFKQILELEANISLEQEDLLRAAYRPKNNGTLIDHDDSELDQLLEGLLE